MTNQTSGEPTITMTADPEDDPYSVEEIVVSIRHNLLHGAHLCNLYLTEARAAGEEELAQFLTKLRDDYKQWSAEDAVFPLHPRAVRTVRW